jgi:hypothetical protein
MADENPHDNGKLRNFSQVIAQLNEGKLNDELSRKLKDLIGDIQNAEDLGAKPVGSLTVKLTFAKDGRVMKVVPTCTVVRPKEPALEADQLYVTPDNNLTLNDQRQPKLPLRDVTGERASDRAVNAV